MKITFIIFSCSLMLSYFAVTSVSLINAQTTNTTANLPIVEITSPDDGEEVPVGQLTIEGNSSDTEESNCQVYADVNDIIPLQNVTAEGSGNNDFSEWTFTYTEDYQLITEGDNELTAKISCFDNGTVSDWHTINVTGVGSQEIVSTNTNVLEDPSLSFPSVATNGVEEEG